MEQLFDQHPRVVPIVWYESGTPSPGVSARRAVYGGGGIPYAVFGGTREHLGGISNYSPYLQSYNQLISYVSPLKLDIDLAFDAQGQLELSTTVEVTNAFTEANNRIYFLITLDGPGNPRFLIVRSGFQQFTQNQVGSVQTYTESFAMDPSWNFEHIRAVSFVQSISSPRRILQANYSALQGVMPNYAADITKGPPSLVVNFSDTSYTTYDIQSWAWDFDNDGIVDSTEPQAVWVYDEPGVYTVSLTLTSELGENTIVRDNYITVTGSDNISGTLAGNWKESFSPYIIKGNIDIPSNTELVIDPGVEVIIDEGVTITVTGAIISNGEPGNEVKFTSNTGWQSIFIEYTDDVSKFYHTVFDKSISGAIRTNSANIYMEGCVFTNNNSSSQAAALHLNGSGDSVIKGSFFANNRATLNSGAISLSGSKLLIENSIFVNNTGRNSGAISAVGGSNLTVVNSTVYNNENTHTPGGSIANTSSTTNVMNSIVSGENPILNLNGTLTVTYSNVAGVDGIGNISADPLFENESSGIGHEIATSYLDWILSDESPCIDAGNPDEEFNDINDPETPGMALHPAKGTLRNDMGAFGGGGSKWLPEGEDVLPKPFKAISIEAYPNPFNPNLSLNITVQDLSSPLNVSIFNVRGQKVYELMHEIPKSTSFTLQWDGKSSDHRELSSGIYLIRASNGNYVDVKRAVLLK